MMPLKELEVVSNKLDSLDEKDLMTLVKWFRFDEMLSISYYDVNYLRLLIRFLGKLMYKDPFFKTQSVVRHSLEFVLTNILTAGKLEEHLIEDFSNLLHILSYIVKRSLNTNTLKFVIFEQKDRCFEAVAFGATLAISKFDCVTSCIDILSELLKNVDCINAVASKSTIEVFQLFKKMKLLRELTTTCYLVCERFSVGSEVFSQCVRWFFTTGSDIFKTAQDEDIKLGVLKTANVLCSKLNDLKMPDTKEILDIKYLFRRYKEASLKISSQILLLSKSDSLRDEAMKLFWTLFSEYSDHCVQVDSETFKKLPEHIEKWHKSGEMLFFEVVGFLCKHDKPCWSSKEIIKSIASLLYSRRIFRISKEHVKIVSYIYPMVLLELPTEQNLLVGDHLLILITNFNLSEILTLHVSQLVWILTRGNNILKTATLYYWLKHSDNVDAMARPVKRCKAIGMLYTFIKNQDVEEIVCQRAIDVLYEIGDPECALFMARMLTQTYKQPKIFNKLMLAGPSLFEHREDALNICRFVSLILVTITEEEAFKAACTFINNLLTKWKNDEAVFGAFFSDTRTMLFLIKKMKYVCEETIVVMMDLLKTLLALQKRHGIYIALKLRINLDSALMGSEYKASKGVDILNLIMNTKDTFFQMDDALVQSAAFKLFDVCKQQKMESKCLRCLTAMMKANNWLAFKSSTNMFVELKCLSDIERRSCTEFVEFLNVWLNILKSVRSTELGYVAHEAIVRNYLKRVDILIGLRQSKKRKLFRMLKSLAMLRDWKFGPRYGDQGLLAIEMKPHDPIL